MVQLHRLCDLPVHPPPSPFLPQNRWLFTVELRALSHSNYGCLREFYGVFVLVYKRVELDYKLAWRILKDDDWNCMNPFPWHNLFKF